MEILLANSYCFPKLVAVRGQAAAPVSKPHDVAPSTALGEMSAQAQGRPLLLLSSVGTLVVQRCCPADPGSPAALREPGQQRNLFPALTDGQEGCTQLHPI